MPVAPCNILINISHSPLGSVMLFELVPYIAGDDGSYSAHTRGHKTEPQAWTGLQNR